MARPIPNTKPKALCYRPHSLYEVGQWYDYDYYRSGPIARTYRVYNDKFTDLGYRYFSVKFFNEHFSKP